MNEKEVIVLNDDEIVQLYFERSEDGIAQSQQQYGKLCRSVIRRILPDERDAEECLSDLWVRVWNSIPPERPRALGAFLARIARNLALDRLSYNAAEKRDSALTEAFEELAPCLVGADDTQRGAEAAEFRAWINAFLRAQTKLIQPKIIVCLGRIAAMRLIRPDFKISREHGQFTEKGGILFTALYHPSALLRDESKRPDTFSDLKALQAKVREVCTRTL